MTVDTNSMTNEHDLIQQGDEAEALLSSEAFNTVVNRLVESTFQTFVNTKPEDTERREITYNHYRALVDIVNTLKQFVSVRDEIMAKNDNSDNNGE